MSTSDLKIKDVMSKEVRYAKHDTPIKEAANLMAELECGFLPISDEKEKKFQGVVTDRDIVIRGVAAGIDPNDVTIDQVKSEKVLYCFEDQSLEEAIKSMQEQQVWRLIVLDKPESKQLSGVISVGDILRAGEKQAASAVAQEIAKAA